MSDASGDHREAVSEALREAIREPAVDLSVIMCALNEADRIPRALEELDESARGRPEIVEVIILDNGSTDGTRDWLASIDRPDVRVVLNETNLGKGFSIRRGIEMSRGAYVVIHDPDLEYRAEDVWKLLDAAREEGAGLALGSRVLGGEVAYEYLMNYLGVRLLTGVINLLFGSRITDSATAMKLLDGPHARSMKLDSSGFDLDFELVTRTARLGGKIIERPVSYMPRTVAQGKKLRAYRDGALALRAILRDRLLPASRFVRSTSRADSAVDLVSGR